MTVLNIWQEHTIPPNFPRHSPIADRREDDSPEDSGVYHRRQDDPPPPAKWDAASKVASLLAAAFGIAVIIFGAGVSYGRSESAALKAEFLAHVVQNDKEHQTFALREATNAMFLGIQQQLAEIQRTQQEQRRDR